MNPDRGTQYLTALAAPEELIDWRLALCFQTAHDNGILDALPSTAERIAIIRGLEVSAVRAVLSVLVAWKHLRIDDSGQYTEGPGWLKPHERDALAQHGTWIRRWASELPRRVHERETPSPDAVPRPGPAAGLASLESASRPFIGPVVEACVRELSRTRAASSSWRVLDLGGGHGSYTREFARRGCEVTLQDLPAVIEFVGTDERFTGTGIKFFAGDAFSELATGPFDLVLCGTLTNMFDLEHVRDLLARVRGVLAPEAHIAIATWMRDHGPVGAAFSVQMLVGTQLGDAHGEADYREVLRGTGFSDIRVVDAGYPPLSVVIAKK